MNQLLKELRKAMSPKELERSWEGFKIEFGLSDPKKRFMNYMEKHWMAIKERPKWVLYVREVSCNSDRNYGEEANGIHIYSYFPGIFK